MTTGWLLLLLVVSSQSVDSQSTTDDEVCDGQQSNGYNKILLQVLQQLETIMNRLGKYRKDVREVVKAAAAVQYTTSSL